MGDVRLMCILASMKVPGAQARSTDTANFPRLAKIRALPSTYFIIMDSGSLTRYEAAGQAPLYVGGLCAGLLFSSSTVNIRPTTAEQSVDLTGSP
jgi:hypothetical protein